MDSNGFSIGMMGVDLTKDDHKRLGDVAKHLHDKGSRYRSVKEGDEILVTMS
jgi:hypothetical protein